MRLEAEARERHVQKVTDALVALMDSAGAMMGPATLGATGDKVDFARRRATGDLLAGEDVGRAAAAFADAPSKETFNVLAHAAREALRRAQASPAASPA